MAHHMYIHMYVCSTSNFIVSRKKFQNEETYIQRFVIHVINVIHVYSSSNFIVSR
jgi:hypothetical protein